MINETGTNNYHITFYFSDNINFETNVTSELGMNDFIFDFNFIGDGKKASINMNNVLFYVID